jgi:hypothetical protein
MWRFFDWTLALPGTSAYASRDVDNGGVVDELGHVVWELRRHRRAVCLRDSFVEVLLVVLLAPTVEQLLELLLVLLGSGEVAVVLLSACEFTR